MRNKFIKRTFIIVFLFLLNLLIPKQVLIAQTILNQGDLVILGVNANTGGSPDEISFVCFKDITTGTEIQITDQGYEYCAAGFWGNYEGGAKLTRTGGTITAGTVITFKTNLIAFLFPDAAWSVADLDPTVLALKLNLNSGGDQIYFAQGGVWTSNGLCNNDYPGSSGRILFGFSTSGAWISMGNSTKESALYPSASCFNMAPTGKTDFNKYTGPLTAATQSAWIKRVGDPLNWTSYGSSAAYFSASPNLHTKVIPILPGTVADWTAPTGPFCSSDAPVNLNPFITGSPGGTWTGTGVTGNTFNPAGLNGSYDITYTVLTPCPVSQTHQLIVNASPLSPVVTSPVTYCENAVAIALSATGTNLLWYTTASGGTGTSSAPVPSTIVAGGLTYYVSETANACESPRAAILVTTIATPALPTVTSPISYCQNATATALSAAGTNLLWYTAATNGIGTSTAPIPVTTTTGSTTYYVSETVNTCESFRAPIIVNINDTPVVITQPSTAPQNICLNGPVNTLSVVANTGSGTITNYQWYITTSANNTGGAAIPFATSASYTPSSSSVGSIYFYCKITNSNGCSTKSNLSGLLKVSALVATPTATATVQPTCNTPTGAIVITAPAGINIEYSNGGAYQASGTFSGLGAGSYNITARNKISGCISIIKVVTVNALPAGPALPTASVTVQPDCLTPTATIVVTSPAGINLEYSVGGTYQSGTTFTGLTNGATYNVTVKDILTGCISAALPLTVNNIPGAPAAPSTMVIQPTCLLSTGTITITTPTSSSYEYSSGGTYQPGLVFSGLAAGTSYTVTVKDNSTGCISAPANITMDAIPATPADPAVSSPVTYCLNATPSTLSASGSNLLWYTSATGGTGTGTAPTPNTTSVSSIIFYVSQTVTGCESSRASITVTTNGLPVAPTVTTPVTYCTNSVTTQLMATGSNLLWYTTATGGTGSTTAPTPSATPTGNTIYYVSQTSNGCEGPRAAITVTINAVPPAPSVTSPVVYCENSTAVALTATGNNLLWYNVSTGGTGSSTAPIPATTSPGSTQYYVSQTSTGCEGGRAAITVTINAVPVAPAATSPIVYCQNATPSALSATGTNLLWYTTATGGTGTVTAPVPATNIPGNKTYYVSQTINGCEGPKSSIVVTINATPASPAITSPVFYCQNNTAVPLTASGSNLLWYNTATSVPGSTTAPTPATITAANTFYYVSQTIVGCEGARAAITVTVSATITPVTGFKYNPDTVCANGINPGPVYNIGFTKGGIFSSTTGLSINAANGNINLAASTPNTYIVTYKYTANGCILGGSSTSSITIKPLVSTNTIFSYNSPVCINGINPSPSVTGAFTTGGTYNSTAGLSVNSTTGAINLATSVPNTYQITYSLPTLGCRLATSNFSFITIQTNSTPVTGFSYNPAAVCPGDNNPVLTSNSGFALGGTFTALPTGLSLNATSGAINVALSSMGVYKITYRVLASGCRVADSTTTTFIVRGATPPDTKFSYNSPVCKNDINAIPVKAATFSAGGVFSSTTGLFINAASGVVDLSQSNSGNYVINYALQSSACSAASTDSTDLTIITQPPPPAFVPIALCNAGPVVLNASGNGIIKWYTDVETSTLVNTGNSFSTNISANTTYYLTNTVGTCISAAYLADIKLSSIPAAPVLGNDTSICKGDVLVLFAGIYNSYLWQDDSKQPTYTVTNSGIYSVTVSNSEGCKNSSSIAIEVLTNCDDIYFPSAFSPNDDGRNDKFGPLGNLFVVSNYSLKIFNRYGEIIFQTNNPYQKWDGSIAGKKYGNINFVWVANYNYRGKVTKTQKGNVLIVK